MANINISDLRPAGTELLTDSESFLNELTNEELDMAHGGSTPGCLGLSLLVFNKSLALSVIITN